MSWFIVFGFWCSVFGCIVFPGKGPCPGFSLFPERALAQGSLCPGRLCLLPGEDSVRAGGLKCRKNAVKMKVTSKNAGKVAFG